MANKYFVNSKKLHTYVYIGQDCSASYQYFLSPLAGYLVNFFPMWIS